MRTRAELAHVMLASGHRIVVENIKNLTLDEALASAGGYRSILGVLKHTAAWSRVYHSYAFEADPRHWDQTDWPRGLRDTIEPTQQYMDEILAWLESSYERWNTSLKGLSDESFDEPRPCHWGATAPLFEIVLMVLGHWIYHSGELNQILAVLREEAWELGEEVEENHISTAGHRIRPNWASDDVVKWLEDRVAKLDAKLHGTPSPTS
jgi:NTP pyrophosphatase (non-canonical NTP hydrolase)